MTFALPDGAEPVERIDLIAIPSVPCVALHLSRYCWACSKISPGSTVLDIACGTGYGSNLLASLPAMVTGVEVDTTALNTARERHSEVEHLAGKLDWVQATAEEYLDSIPAKAFDWIVSFETLEHVDDLFAFLEQLLRVYKVGLLLSVPHNEPPNSWPFHKTFQITKELLEKAIPSEQHLVSFYGQQPQPACQIQSYSVEASDLLLEIKRC